MDDQQGLAFGACTKYRRRQLRDTRAGRAIQAIGPLLCWYSEFYECWTLHQKPATKQEILDYADQK